MHFKYQQLQPHQEPSFLSKMETRFSFYLKPSGKYGTSFLVSVVGELQSHSLLDFNPTEFSDIKPIFFFGRR